MRAFKKNVASLCLASLAMALLSGQAQAIKVPGGADSDALRVSESGVGHMLVVPYYSTQNGNATLLSLINTDEVNGKAVKVRFRGARNADLVYDLQVFLSPGDVWTANVSQNAQGLSFLTTEDNSCTKPAKATVNSTPFQTSRLNPNVSDVIRAGETREGYVEIITLADIPINKTSGVFPLIQQDRKTAQAICADNASNTSWSALNTDLENAAAYAALGLTPPTSGITANWTLMNVPKALSWSGAATAFEARKGDAPAKGNLVYFPQTPVGFPELSNFSADPLFAGEKPVVMPMMYDLPDLSTPYYVGATSAAAQANALADTLAVKRIINEFWTEDAIHADTDWQFTMPTRRFAAVINYAAEPKPAVIFNAAVAAHFSAATTKFTGNSICVFAENRSLWDRDAHGIRTIENDVVGISDPYSTTLSCGATHVLGINDGSLMITKLTRVLSGGLSMSGYEMPFKNGWSRLSTPPKGKTEGSFPVIGNAFVQATNPNVAPGTAGNFGLVWPHRLLKR